MFPQNELELTRIIDQTNLRPEINSLEMTAFLHEVRKYNFASAAIMPVWVPLASEILSGSRIAVDASVGFPLGTTPTKVKVAETRWSIQHSPECSEIDMVMNLSMFKSGRYKEVEDDIRAVVEAADGIPVKVIIEVPLLSREEILVASMLCERAGAAYIKTSTGFKSFKGWRPSTPDDIRLIRSVISDKVKIKIAGGITTYEQVLTSLEAGANRIGTIWGIQIVDGYRKFSGVTSMKQ